MERLRERGVTGKLTHTLTARLRGFLNGMDPRHGLATVIVSKDTGDIVKIVKKEKKPQEKAT